LTNKKIKGGRREGSVKNMNRHEIIDLWILALLMLVVTLLTNNVYWAFLSLFGMFVAAIISVGEMLDEVTIWCKDRKRRKQGTTRGYIQ